MEAKTHGYRDELVNTVKTLRQRIADLKRELDSSRCLPDSVSVATPRQQECERVSDIS